MTRTCQECGAALADGTACIDLFHTLLLLEHEVAADSVGSGDRRVAHFYAVSAYILQHPLGMGYTAAALAGARRGLADHLAGKLSLEQLRHRVRLATNGPVRITRRADDEVVRWPVDAWPLTVADVIAGGVPGYTERVTAWAESIVETLACNA